MASLISKLKRKYCFDELLADDESPVKKEDAPVKHSQSIANPSAKAVFYVEQSSIPIPAFKSTSTYSSARSLECDDTELFFGKIQDFAPLKSSFSAPWNTLLWTDVCSTAVTWDILKQVASSNKLKLAARKQKPCAFLDPCGDKLARTPVVLLDTLQTYASKWKSSKPILLCGESSCGKTSMLRALSSYLKMECVFVHADSYEELKESIIGSTAHGLTQETSMWVIEHWDLMDARCKDLVRKCIQKGIQGPVFLTSNLDNYRPHKNSKADPPFQIVTVWPWEVSLQKELLYTLQVPRTLEEYTAALHQCSGSLGAALSMLQAGSVGKKDIPPHNLRFLIEDIMCDRTSPIKSTTASENDVDTCLSLVQEMIPSSLAWSASKSCHLMASLLDAASFCDSTCSKLYNTECMGLTLATIATVCSSKPGKTVYESGRLQPLPASISLHKKTVESKSVKKELLQLRKMVSLDYEEEFHASKYDVRNFEEDADYFRLARGKPVFTFK